MLQHVTTCYTHVTTILKDFQAEIHMLHMLQQIFKKNNKILLINCCNMCNMWSSASKPYIISVTCV